jgi:hypothetical protein
MSGQPNFGVLLERFFTQRLMQQRQASAHTVASYRDTFKMLLQFVHKHLGKAPSALALDDIDAPLVMAFLDDAERTRGITARTVDGKAARLAILTDDGRVIASGNQVAKEVEAVALNSYRNFLKGQGYLRVHSKRSFNRDLASDADLVCDSPVKLTADGRLGS